MEAVIDEQAVWRRVLGGETPPEPPRKEPEPGPGPALARLYRDRLGAARLLGTLAGRSAGRRRQILSGGAGTLRSQAGTLLDLHRYLVRAQIPEGEIPGFTDLRQVLELLDRDRETLEALGRQAGGCCGQIFRSLRDRDEALFRSLLELV